MSRQSCTSVPILPLREDERAPPCGSRAGEDAGARTRRPPSTSDTAAPVNARAVSPTGPSRRSTRRRRRRRVGGKQRHSDAGRRRGGPPAPAGRPLAARPCRGRPAVARASSWLSSLEGGAENRARERAGQTTPSCPSTVPLGVGRQRMRVEQVRNRAPTSRRARARAVRRQRPRGLRHTQQRRCRAVGMRSSTHQCVQGRHRATERAAAEGEEGGPRERRRRSPRLMALRRG